MVGLPAFYLLRFTERSGFTEAESEGFQFTGSIQMGYNTIAGLDLEILLFQIC